jgi:hypothetical protein
MGTLIILGLGAIAEVRMAYELWTFDPEGIMRVFDVFGIIFVILLLLAKREEKKLHEFCSNPNNQCSLCFSSGVLHYRGDELRDYMPCVRYPHLKGGMEFKSKSYSDSEKKFISYHLDDSFPNVSVSALLHRDTLAERRGGEFRSELS